MSGPVDPSRLEGVAADLSGWAGTAIARAAGAPVDVEYKSGATEHMDLRHPVTEVDRAVEAEIRSRLDALFPDHDVLGEEGRNTITGAEYLWAIDPIDGTANFANGYPLYAATVGVLHKGRPVAGAVWCTTGHALFPGVYHARSDGALAFDGTRLERVGRAGLRRRLSGVSASDAHDAPALAPRISGSAAIECAFVACGILAAARFDHVNLWDIAGGCALVLASGGLLATRVGDEWSLLTDFGSDPASWSGPLVVAESAAAARDVLATATRSGQAVRV